MVLLWKFSHWRFCLSISFGKQKIMLFDVKEIFEREFLGCDYGNGNDNIANNCDKQISMKKMIDVSFMCSW